MGDGFAAEQLGARRNSVDVDRADGVAPGAAGWFEVVVLVASTALVVSGLASLVWALVDARSMVMVLATATIASAAALIGMRATLVELWRRPSSRTQHGAAAAALLLAVLAVGWYGYQPSQHLLVERDPGAYVSTSLWMSRDGSLVDRAVGDDFEGVPGLSFASPGSYLTADGLQFQFNHFTSAVGAVAHDLGGHRALFRVTGWVTVLGLLSAYAVLARSTRRPWLSLLGPVALGASLPVVVLARDMYSEPYLLAVLWALVLLLDQCWRRPARGAAVIAGLFSGALVTIRVESVLYLTALAVLAAFVWFRGRPAQRALVAPWLAGTRSGSGGRLLRLRGAYRRVHRGDRHRGADRCGVVPGGRGPGGRGAVELGAPGRRAWLVRAPPPDARRPRRRSVAVLLAGLWLLRPLLPVDRLEVERWGVLGAIQAREGDVVDPFRSYYELSVRWIEWYVGPAVVALGIVGIAAMVHRLVRGRLDAGGTVALAVFSTGGLAYLLAPGINPDQLWATRRLVPVALVMIVFAAVWAVGALMDRAGGRRGAAPAVGVLAAVVFILPTVHATAPIALVSEQPAMWGALGAVCDDAGDDGAIAVVGVPARDLLPMALRSRCGVPVAELDTGDRALAIDHARELASTLGSRGRRLTLVAMDPADLVPFEDAGLGSTRRSALTGNPREHEHTLNRRPARYLGGDEVFFLPRDIAVWSLPVGAQ